MRIFWCTCRYGLEIWWGHWIPIYRFTNPFCDGHGWWRLRRWHNRMSPPRCICRPAQVGVRERSDRDPACPEHGGGR
jgi:hypothetical protein